MAHLHDLPREIVYIILYKLQKPTGWTDYEEPRPENLSKLALASKPLLPLTQKVLYSEFWSFERKQTWKIRALLCTLIANPRLALHVQLLLLKAWRAWDRKSDKHDDYGGQDWDEDRKYAVAQVSRDRKLFRKAIRNLALTNKKRWRDAVMKDVDEVYVALLILICPNITELNMEGPCNPVFIDKILDHATIVRPVGSMLPNLRNLKNVSWSCRGFSSRLDFSHLVPLFRLPAIQDLDISDVSSRGALPLLSSNNTLKNLSMDLMDVETNFLCTILSHLKALEKFHYWHRGYYREEIPSHALQLDDLGRVMNNMATLQDLDLKFDNLSSRALGSLRGCSRLRRLDMSLFDLIAFEHAGYTARLVDVLPNSLDELMIIIGRMGVPPSRSCSDMIDQVCEMVNLSSTKFPALRKMSLTIRGERDTQPETAHWTPVVKLVRACRTQNVALETLKWEDETYRRDIPQDSIT